MPPRSNGRARLLRDRGGVDSSRIDALLRAVASRAAVPERLTIRTREGVQFVRVAEVDWMQADGNYTRLHIGTGSTRIRETISDLDARLCDFGFMRVHRSIIVNTDRIFRIEPWSHGEYLIVLRNGTKINSGRGYTDQIRALFS